MTPKIRILLGIVPILLLPFVLLAEQPKAGVLSAQQVKKFAPSTFFFDGQSAPVQLRNTAGFSTDQGKLIMAGFVDISGYSTDVLAKYQGFFVTEVKVNIEGSDLAPGEYGFGFSKEGKFVVMDVGANDQLSVDAHTDEKLAHPVPLKVTADDGSYRLYAGRRWVAIKPE